MKAWHLVLEVRAHALDPQHSDFLPKRYLHDPGIVNRHRTIAVPSVSLLRTLDPPLRTSLGGLFENAVLLSLLEGESAKKQVGTWRKAASSAMEVDFVLDAGEAGQGFSRISAILSFMAPSPLIRCPVHASPGHDYSRSKGTARQLSVSRNTLDPP
jgi:hypothetical protein